MPSRCRSVNRKVPINALATALDLDILYQGQVPSHDQPVERKVLILVLCMAINLHPLYLNNVFKVSKLEEV